MFLSFKIKILAYTVHRILPHIKIIMLLNLSSPLLGAFLFKLLVKLTFTHEKKLCERQVGLYFHCGRAMSSFGVVCPRPIALNTMRCSSVAVNKLLVEEPFSIVKCF